MTPREEPLSLPQWLNELLPEDRPVKELHVYDESQHVIYSDGTQREFADLEEVHNDGYEPDADTRVFNHRTKAKDESEGLFGTVNHVSYRLPNGFYGMVFSHTDADRRKRLEDNYAEALERIAAYRESPQDFLLAWQMIDKHPGFWTLAVDYSENPWFWETEGYCSKLRQYVYRNDDGKVIVSLEAGGHVPTRQNFDTGVDDVDYRGHYGDWRLEVGAASFEDAILELAARVVICFNDDGSDRADAEETFAAVKPEWVKDLEGRLDDLEDPTES